MPETWERLTGETDKAWAAFCAYRDLPVQQRSIKKAQELHTGKELPTRHPSRHWLGWSQKFQWTARARAYDAHVEMASREGLEASHHLKLRDHLDQQERLAAHAVEASIRLLKLSNDRLKYLEDKMKAAPKPKKGAKKGTQPTVPEVPADVTRGVRAAVAAGDAASAARSEALGVEQLLGMLEDEGAA